jgi:hypothetical protein
LGKLLLEYFEKALSINLVMMRALSWIVVLMILLLSRVCGLGSNGFEGTTKCSLVERWQLEVIHKLLWLWLLLLLGIEELLDQRMSGWLLARERGSCQHGYIRSGSRVLLHHLREEHDLLELGLFKLALEIRVLLHFLVEHDRDFINL